MEPPGLDATDRHRWDVQGQHRPRTDPRWCETPGGIDIQPREWTREDVRAELRRRQALVDAGICPDAGEPMVLTETSWGPRLMCPACDCFGIVPEGVR